MLHQLQRSTHLLFLLSQRQDKKEEEEEQEEKGKELVTNKSKQV